VRAANVAEKLAFNRTVYASHLVAARATENRSRTNALYAVLSPLHKRWRSCFANPYMQSRLRRKQPERYLSFWGQCVSQLKKIQKEKYFFINPEKSVILHRI
jgi:hypothetical protein